VENDRIRLLFDDLERKRDIAEFLELTETGEGVRIFIGSENKFSHFRVPLWWCLHI
jgi:heat-inducible transcriptional repressor